MSRFRCAPNTSYSNSCKLDAAAARVWGLIEKQTVYNANLHVPSKPVNFRCLPNISHSNISCFNIAVARIWGVQCLPNSSHNHIIGFNAAVARIPGTQCAPHTNHDNVSMLNAVVARVWGTPEIAMHVEHCQTHTHTHTFTHDSRNCIRLRLIFAASSKHVGLRYDNKVARRRSAVHRPPIWPRRVSRSVNN